MTRTESFLLRYSHWAKWGLLVLVLLCGWVVFVLGRDKGLAVIFTLCMTLPAWLISRLVGEWATAKRERIIREQPIPGFLRRKLREAYPHLTAKDAELVEHGLRQFFLACSRSPRLLVAMPSRVVDSMWHEFILHTRLYKQWCNLALGRFLHHTPAEALGEASEHNNGLRRTWFWACKAESINPRKPLRLPLLFALDAKLGIAGGFHYLPDCNDIDQKSTIKAGETAYCASNFAEKPESGDNGRSGSADSSDVEVTGSDGSDGGDGGSCGGGGD